MKKLLTILAAVGLTATATASVMACSTTIQKTTNPNEFQTNSEVQSLMNQLQAVSNQRNQLQAINAQLKDEVSGKDEQIKSLEAIIQKYKDLINDLKTQKQDLQQQINALSKDDQHYQDRVSDLNKQITQKDNEIASLTKDNETKQGQINSLTNEKNDLQDKLGKANEQIKNNDKEINDLNKKISDLQNKNTDLTNKLTAPGLMTNITAKNSDLKEFDITLSKNITDQETQIDLTDKPLSLSTTSTLFEMPEIQSASINKNNLHIVLANSIPTEFNYVKGSNYDFQLKLSKNLFDNNLVQGNSLMFNVTPKTAGHLTSSTPTYNNRLITIDLGSSQVKQGDITNDVLNKLSVESISGTDGWNAKVQSVNVVNTMMTIQLTQDTIEPTTDIDVFNGFFLKLSSDIDGIEHGTSLPADALQGLGNSQVNLNNASVSIGGNIITVSTDSNLFKEIVKDDITLEGTDSKPAFVLSQIGTNQITIRLDKPLEKDSEVKLTIKGFANSANALIIDTSKIDSSVLAN